MRKIMFALIVPAMLFASINKVFEKKYLSNVPKFESEINQSKLLRYNLNLNSVNTEVNKTLKNVKFNPLKSKKASLEAKEINSYLKSQTFNKRVYKMKQYILYDKKIDFSKYIKGYLHTPQKILNGERVYVVISSSMPVSTIRNYFQTAQRANRDIVFVLRGIIGNDLKHIKPTLLWLNKVLTKNPDVKTYKHNRYKVIVEINPKVTEHFHITEVPAVIFVKNYNGFLDRHVSLPQNSNEEAYIAYGDANLIYTLEQINKKAKDKNLQELIKKLRGGFFQ